jgi:hypothetical protein
MLTLQNLPLEIIARILFLGCDNYFEFSSAGSPGIRRLKPFAKVAASVCRDWRDIVRARSGHRYWCKYLIFGSSGGEWIRNFDAAKAAAQFKHWLESSDNCDIDLRFTIYSYGTLSQTLEPIERFSIHVFLMLVPFAGQIRSMSIHSRPLTQWLLAITSLGPLPRLEYLELSGDTKSSIDPVDSLLSRKYTIVLLDLDLSSALDGLTLVLKNWNVLGHIKTHQNISDLTVTNCWSRNLASASWEDVYQLLKENLDIRNLNLSTSGVAFAFKQTRAAPACLPLLKAASLRTSAETFCALFCLFSPSSLQTLDLTLVGADRVVDGSPSPSDLVQLPSLVNMRLRFYCSSWTEMHDNCFVALLPPRLQEVSLLFANKQYTPPLWPLSNPRKYVSHLEINASSRVGWINMLSRWDPEHLEVHGSVYANRSTFDSDKVLRMDHLSRLTLNASGLVGLCLILSKLDAPSLKQVTFGTGNYWERIKVTMDYQPFAAARQALRIVRTLEVRHSASRPSDFCDELPIEELSGLEALTISMMIVSKGNVGDLLKVLKKFQSNESCPQLIQLTVELSVRTKLEEKVGFSEEKAVQAAIRKLQASRRRLKISHSIVII